MIYQGQTSVMQIGYLTIDRLAVAGYSFLMLR